MKGKITYSFGEVHINKYTGTKITEVLADDKKTAGWLWSLIDGRIVVSPHLGFYIWFDGRGREWTIQGGATWLYRSYMKYNRSK